MIYGSVCSGMEAATAAWHPLGWTPAFFSEIDKAPASVLRLKYPDVPNLGDMTKFEEWPDAVLDVLAGGTPCQSFSVAGLRGGLDDQRGNLMLVFAAIARRYRSRWLVWENVPGVLSSDGGRDFGSLLGLLSGRRITAPADGWRNAGFVPGIESAYGLAWRVLDAQYVRVESHPRAVPQRRRRVFVVGYLGDWRPAAAVFLEREGLSGNPPPRRKAGQGAAAGTLRGTDGGCDVDHARAGHLVVPPVGNPLTARMHKGVNTTMDEGQTMVAVAPTLRAGGNSTGGDRPPGTDVDTCDSLVPVAFKASHFTRGKDGAPPDVAFPLSADADKGDQDTLVVAPTLEATAGKSRGAGTPVGMLAPIAFRTAGDGAAYEEGEVTAPLTTNTDPNSNVVAFDTTQITNPDNRSNPQPGGACHPLAAGAHPPALAYDLRGRDGGAQLEGPHETANLRAANGGSSRSYVQTWAVRRLTPLECTRLQGFPEYRSKLLVSQCDHKSATQFVSIAEAGSSTFHPDLAQRAALHVLINSGKKEVRISRAGRLIWSASTAEKSKESAPSMQVDDFVRLGVAMTIIAGRTTRNGAAALLPRTRLSTHPESGHWHVVMSGLETNQRVNGVATAMSVDSDLLTSIISCDGPNDRTLEQIAATLFSCAVAAIASYIQPTTSTEYSSTVLFEIEEGYFDVPVNKPLADGPKYKMLGNSMAVNVMSWIGQRIRIVDDIVGGRR